MNNEGRRLISILKTLGAVVIIALYICAMFVAGVASIFGGYAYEGEYYLYVEVIVAFLLAVGSTFLLSKLKLSRKWLMSLVVPTGMCGSWTIIVLSNYLQYPTGKGDWFLPAMSLFTCILLFALFFICTSGITAILMRVKHQKHTGIVLLSGNISGHRLPD